MTLYLYQTGAHAPVLALEHMVSYTADQVVTEAGCYGPLAEGCELSATPDCSGTLRADYRRDYPSAETRLEDLETLVAELLFGGDAE